MLLSHKACGTDLRASLQTDEHGARGFTVAGPLMLLALDIVNVDSKVL